jgi:hypothetical protein
VVGARTTGAKILFPGGAGYYVTHDGVTFAHFYGNRRIIKSVLIILGAQFVKALSRQLPERFAKSPCVPTACDPWKAKALVSRDDRHRLFTELSRFPVERDQCWFYAEV